MVFDMVDRIGQIFEHKLPEGLTKIIEIVGVETAGYNVDDDSYKATVKTMFLDGTSVSGSVWYCDIDVFEYNLKKGLYKQIK